VERFPASGETSENRKSRAAWRRTARPPRIALIAVEKVPFAQYVFAREKRKARALFASLGADFVGVLSQRGFSGGDRDLTDSLHSQSDIGLLPPSVDFRG